MGLPYDEQRFNDAIKKSCFESDVKDMPLQEMTMVGNRGVGLSGG